MNERPTLLKPVGPESLANENDLRLGEILVRPSLLEIRAGEVRETLEPRVMQVLVALARAIGMVVSRDELIRECWGGRIVGEDAINRCVARIRRLADLSGNKAFEIETIPRVGYRLIPAATMARTADESDRKAPPLAAVPPAPSNALYLWFAFAAVAAIALALAVYEMRIRPAPPSALSAGPVQASVAVLPFKNLSSDKDAGYLAEGVQDEVLTRLAKIGSLKVVSRTSTEEFATHAPSIREIARRLGVANILEGNVQKSGNRIRINVQLIRAANDDHLWAEDYDRKLDDTLSVESDVAGAIAGVLAAKMTPHERAEIAERPTANPRAYDLYLRGLVFAHKNDDTSLHTAIQLFQQAVAADPKFAAAWARLARMQAFMHFGEDLATVRRGAARAALAKALALQPDLPEVQAAKGFYLYYGELNLPAAERELERVHARWPNNADALEALALVLRRLGRWKESTTDLARLVSLDPLAQTHRISLAFNLTTMHDYAGALRVLDNALQIWPDNGWILSKKATVFQYMGQLDLADAALKNVHPAPDDTDVGNVVWEQFWLKRQFARCAAFFKGTLYQAPDASTDVAGLTLTGVGECLRMAGDAKGAREYYAKARDVLVAGLKVRPARPSPWDFLCLLALDYSGLGDSRMAMANVNHAIDILRAPYYAMDKLGALTIRTEVMAASGDRGAAIAELSRLVKLPGGLTPAMLRLDPYYDPLRGDPRFEALAHSDTKKTI